MTIDKKLIANALENFRQRDNARVDAWTNRQGLSPSIESQLRLTNERLGDTMALLIILTKELTK
jgi:hypothetical protein